MFGPVHELFVFRFKLFQGGLMGLVYFLSGPSFGKLFGKAAFDISVEIADYAVGHAENAGKLQDALVNQLQRAYIRKVVAVQKIENDHV